jgi:hypothetical protein
MSNPTITVVPKHTITKEVDKNVSKDVNKNNTKDVDDDIDDIDDYDAIYDSIVKDYADDDNNSGDVNVDNNSGDVNVDNKSGDVNDGLITVINKGKAKGFKFTTTTSSPMD